MEHYSLENLYVRGEFKRGGSATVDEAIAAVVRVLRNIGEQYTHSRFWSVWQKLLAVIAQEFAALLTNDRASLRNLAYLSLPLGAKRLSEEELTLLLIQETHVPSSCEVQVMLGSLYRRMDKLEEAATHFTRGYDLAMQQVHIQELGVSHPIRLDASDYLRYLAEVEVKRNRCPQALVVAMRALNIVQQAGPAFKFKERDAFDLLYRICLMMDLNDLAEEYRMKAKEADSELPI